LLEASFSPRLLNDEDTISRLNYGTSRDRFPFPTLEPAGQHQQHLVEGRGIDHEAELISRADLNNVGRGAEHYAHRG